MKNVNNFQIAKVQHQGVAQNENEIWYLSPKKHYAFSTESSRPPTFWILPKLQELHTKVCSCMVICYVSCNL